jgi:hypothetical protein
MSPSACGAARGIHALCKRCYMRLWRLCSHVHPRHNCTHPQTRLHSDNHKPPNIHHDIIYHPSPTAKLTQRDPSPSTHRTHARARARTHTHTHHTLPHITTHNPPPPPHTHTNTTLGHCEAHGARPNSSRQRCERFVSASDGDPISVRSDHPQDRRREATRSS